MQDKTDPLGHRKLTFFVRPGLSPSNMGHSIGMTLAYHIVLIEPRMVENKLK